MDALTFRGATEADIPTVLALCIGGGIGAYAEPVDASDPAYLQAFRAIAASARDRLVLVEVAGEPVGTLHITYLQHLPLKGMKRALIEHVHVRADRRGQGIGREMMRWAIERAREAGCGVVQLDSNKQRLDAHRFYRGLGFEQSHEGFKLKL